MSKQTFTPGPWSIYDDSDDGKTNRIEIVAIGKTVARIYCSVPNEDLQNARLIAAAPDLLAALEKATAHIEAMMAHIENKPERFKSHCWQQALDARAAIAKATGEPT